jgi:hypothetical protein
MEAMLPEGAAPEGRWRKAPAYGGRFAPSVD